jgi:hypothetical protein
MALWEYKVITSGKGGFATPQLLENFLNQLGKEEWEIVEFRPAPDNFLAFTGLARRATQRDWTLEAAAAAAAKAEAEQRRADERAALAAREREVTAAPTEPTAPPEADEPVRDESFRRPRDTELDQDPEALAEEAGAPEFGDWDDLSEGDDLPTLFEAVRPHLRRNQKGPGQSVAIDYLAKRWEQEPDDIVGALIECGFTVPDTEDSAPDYFEFEGDLYWLNKNNRGQIFLNVREKPRPAFRVTPVRKLDSSDPAAAELAAEHQTEVDRRADQRRQQEAREAAQAAKMEAAKAAKAAKAAEAARPGELPEGEALLATLRPRMRQNRRGGGFSGSTAYLAKAMRRPEPDLVAALAGLGLKAPDDSNAKPDPVEIGGMVYWVNKDGRGGLWINCREKREGEAAEVVVGDSGFTESSAAEPVRPTPEYGEAAASTTERATETGPREEELAAGASDKGTAEAAGAEVNLPTAAADGPLGALRPLLKPNRRGGGSSAELGDLAQTLGKPLIELIETLVQSGLAVPDDAKDKPALVELGDEVLWINRSSKDASLWLNAKSKTGTRRRPGRGRKKSDTDDGEAVAPGAADTGEPMDSEPAAGTAEAPPPDSVERADPRPPEAYKPEEAGESSEWP